MTHEFESHTDQVVWRHNDGRRETVEAAFLAYTGVKDRTIGHQRSIENPGRFWSQVIDFLNIPVLRPPSRAMVIRRAPPRRTRSLSEFQFLASIALRISCPVG